MLLDCQLFAQRHVWPVSTFTWVLGMGAWHTSMLPGSPETVVRVL